MSANDSRVGSDSRSLLDQRLPEFFLALDESSRVKDIGEYATRSTEDPVFQGNSFVDRDIVLYLASIAQAYVRADHDILADDTVSADTRTLQDMGEMPDTRTCTDYRSPVNNSAGMDQAVLRFIFTLLVHCLPFLIDLSALSSTLKTRNPSCTSVLGWQRLDMQSKKCSICSLSGSFLSMATA